MELAADQYGQGGRAALGIDERAQDRQSLHDRHHRQHPAEIAADRASLPSALKIETTSDQSVFVRSAVSAWPRSGDCRCTHGTADPAVPGSWRSTLIITISIPLSILASIACLSALGETINIMTLGGLALASEFWSTMRPSPSKTSITTSSAART